MYGAVSRICCNGRVSYGVKGRGILQAVLQPFNTAPTHFTPVATSYRYMSASTLDPKQQAFIEKLRQTRHAPTQASAGSERTAETNNNNVNTAVNRGDSKHATTPSTVSAASAAGQLSGARLYTNKPKGGAGTAAAGGGRTAPATASSTPSEAGDTPNATVPKNLFERVKHLIKEYGVYAVATYATLWIVPAAGLYQTFYAFDNFGHNPVSILTFLHIKDPVFHLLGLPDDAKPEAWQISAIYAYLGAEMLEVVRLPASLWLAPRLKRLMTKPKAQ